MHPLETAARVVFYIFVIGLALTVIIQTATQTPDTVGRALINIFTVGAMGMALYLFDDLILSEHRTSKD